MSLPNLNAGALAPVVDEVDRTNLQVVGEIPRELCGTLMRNGPNPFSGKFPGNEVLNWWPEAAMLHAITFADGEALSYKNRWVQTQNWANHFGAASAANQLATNPNVNVVQHAGTVLALAEGGQPVAVSRSLDTLGSSAAHPGFARGITAHPKIDPETQEFFAFRADWSEPWLRYCAFDAKGAQTLDTEIELPAPCMMHDMAITQSHSVLMDLNVGYDFSMFERGYRIPICWQDERQSRLCVLPRNGGEVRWFEIAPCFIQHVVNAFDGPDQTVVLDVARYPWYFRLDAAGSGFMPDPLAVLWRYVLHLDSGRVEETQLSELNLELPRINEQYLGRSNRYFYSVEQPTAQEMRGVLRFDLLKGETSRHALAPGDQNSEPVFVARPNGQAEDDGWLLVSVFRRESNTSELRILDATNVQAEPLAVVQLDRRIPAGFHGAWILPD